MAAIQLKSDAVQHIVQAITKPSVLKVTATSAPDVYVNCMVDKTPTDPLSAGESMYVPVGTMRAYLFRKLPDGQVYTADLDLSPV